MTDTEPDGYRRELAALRDELRELRADAVSAADLARERIAAVHPDHRHGARNLHHYLALRSRDLRPLQERLSGAGLSSLGRMEGDVLRNLDAVLHILGAALDDDPPGSPAAGAPDPHDLHVNAAALLGGEAEDRSTRIMVTLPSEAADDASIVQRFAGAGMDLARVNCAHDDDDAWRRMAGHVRAADDAIRVAMDLGGPKLRTGPLAEGPRVVKVKPKRDDAGGVTAPARLLLIASDAEASGDVRSAPVRDAGWLAERTTGETVRFADARGRRRKMRVARADARGVLLEGGRTAYLEEGAVLRCGERETVVDRLDAVEGALRLAKGDTIVLTSSLDPATSEDGRHRIGCTLPEALRAVRPGHRIAFDDGKIEGVVRSVEDGAAIVEVTGAPEGGTKLKAEKGINLPDTDLPVSALTDDDVAALDVVVEVADIVELSFARSAQDVRRLLDELDARGAEHLGVVVKLETTQGFRALPEIILELMRRPRAGIMIARGDLAVEAGFERLAEVQEEMLWLCEAARLPVVWATQVLDDLAKRGVPTRAEITDAATANRAECVMLNKGPRIDDAIRALDDILRRMEGHMDKKRPLLRRLHAWLPDA
ncbi:pyruvate kinase [Microbacterium betulae]|uniref:pyruvate kinase n=1 Tax=Microbacterium betulae TaxID=2981139 RepID=A0AA97I3S3_9MICO|nr:pyruvate kinase [Microbacterium sp. AB]WOF21781.1 pyruvate kinase [Microbacterium sp. AB]